MPKKQEQKGRQRANGEGSVRYKPDKRIYEGRITIDGKPKSVYVSSPTENREKEKECFKKLEALKTLPVEHNTRLAFGALCDNWYSNLEKTVKVVGEKANEINERDNRSMERSTYSNYIYTLMLIKEKFGQMRIKELSPKKIIDGIYEIRKPDDTAYEFGTYKKVKAMLGQIFNYAVLEGIIIQIENPMLSVPNLRDSKRSKSTRSSYTFEQFMELYNKLPDDIWGHFVRLDLAVGGRGQEIRALCGSDITKDGSEIAVCRAVKRNNGSEYIGVTKTAASDRIIQVPEFARPSALYLKYHADVKSGYILYSKRTKRPICYSGYLKSYNKAVKSTGIDRLPPHDMRATYTSIMRNYTNTNDKVLQTMTGHSDMKTMMGYDRPNDSERKVAAEKLNQLYISANSNPPLSPNLPLN